jgi:hypothetical protein
MPVPDLIGRYRLGPRLGSGGFAVVWLAHDESLDTDLAIKVMAENWADRMDLRERFLTEARLLRRASSSRVVQVFDIGELDDGRPYFVMEFADRGTLADRIEHGPMPLVAALRATAEVARGVAELHRAGIVHRDLKPSNVLIASRADGGERLLVADLGVAKSLAAASGLTMSVGSAGYMAPEQSGPNSGLDVRADVYSLGALGYSLVTGHVPGPAGNPVNTDDAWLLPVDVRRVLLRAMEVDRDRRWPDAESLATELDRLAGEYEQRGAAVAGRTRRRRVGLLSALLVLVLVVAGGAGYAVYRRDRPKASAGSSASALVSVPDSTGQIVVRLPRAWAREAKTAGWSPDADLGIKGDYHEPAVLVAGSTDAWSSLSQKVNGVFVGVVLGPGLVPAVDAIRHPGCRNVTSSEGYTDKMWSGTVYRWTNCPGPQGTVVDAFLDNLVNDKIFVYLQIRQDGGADETNTIIGNLRVTG